MGIKAICPNCGTKEVLPRQDGEKGLWLVDAEDLEHMSARFGSDLQVLWTSKAPVAASR